MASVGDLKVNVTVATTVIERTGRRFACVDCRYYGRATGTCYAPGARRFSLIEGWTHPSAAYERDRVVGRCGPNAVLFERPLTFTQAVANLFRRLVRSPKAQR